MKIEDMKKELQSIIDSNEELIDDDFLNSLINAFEDLEEIQNSDCVKNYDCPYCQ